MCTRPINVTKMLAGKPKTYTVPCGKCDECLAKRRNEVALLTLLESDGFECMDYFTLTYEQDKLPVAISERIDGKRRIIGFQRGRDCYDWQLVDFKTKCSPVHDDDGLSVCPSLNPEDWRSHMHRFRAWLRRNDLPKDISFIQFGEYGEKRSRPHHHVVVFGLIPETRAKFIELWESYFGSCRCDTVSRFNLDGSNAFLKISKYISKYISKGAHLPRFVRAGYAIKPRRLSSVGYGRKKLDIERLRSFILPTS